MAIPNCTGSMKLSFEFAVMQKPGLLADYEHAGSSPLFCMRSLDMKPYLPVADKGWLHQFTFGCLPPVANGTFYYSIGFTWDNPVDEEILG